jgi:hypothetical protein
MQKLNDLSRSLAPHQHVPGLEVHAGAPLCLTAYGLCVTSCIPVTKIIPVNEGGGGPPLRDHLWRGPPLPVTLRLIHPPPKMTQGVMTPLTPLHHLQQHP